MRFLLFVTIISSIGANVLAQEQDTAVYAPIFEPDGEGLQINARSQRTVLVTFHNQVYTVTGPTTLSYVTTSCSKTVKSSVISKATYRAITVTYHGQVYTVTGPTTLTYTNCPKTECTLSPTPTAKFSVPPTSPTSPLTPADIPLPSSSPTVPTKLNSTFTSSISSSTSSTVTSVSSLIEASTPCTNSILCPVSTTSTTQIVVLTVSSLVATSDSTSRSSSQSASTSIATYTPMTEPPIHNQTSPSSSSNNFTLTPSVTPSTSAQSPTPQPQSSTMVSFAFVSIPLPFSSNATYSPVRGDFNTTASRDISSTSVSSNTDFVVSSSSDVAHSLPTIIFETYESQPTTQSTSVCESAECATYISGVSEASQVLFITEPAPFESIYYGGSETLRAEYTGVALQSPPTEVSASQPAVLLSNGANTIPMAMGAVVWSIVAFLA